MKFGLWAGGAEQVAPVVVDAGAHAPPVAGAPGVKIRVTPDAHKVPVNG